MLTLQWRNRPVTLLEALVSLVILGVSAVGFLGVFQSTARSVLAAEDWYRVSTTTEGAVEEAVRAHGAGSPGGFERAVSADGAATRVETRPWSSGVDDIVVTVSLPDGRSLSVHRLVRRR